MDKDEIERRINDLEDSNRHLNSDKSLVDLGYLLPICHIKNEEDADYISDAIKRAIKRQIAKLKNELK